MLIGGRIRTEKHRAVVLFFDINNFKSINDSYGHSFGDMCIKSVGKALKSAYGGAGLCVVGCIAPIRSAAKKQKAAAQGFAPAARA